MYVSANLVVALATTLSYVFKFYNWMIIIRVLLSWVNPDPTQPLVQFIYRVTEPLLDPIRRVIGYNTGIDFSPLVALLGITFMEQFVIRSLYDFATRLR